MTQKNNSVWKSIAAAIAIAYGAFVSRWHGGGFFDAPKILKNLAWAVPFGAAATGLWWHQGLPAWAPWAIGAAVTAACTAGKSTGHGNGMDLGRSDPYVTDREPEFVEYPILWLYGRMPQYWYDALVLALAGVLAVLGMIIALAPLSPLAALILTLGGILKAAAYMIGWAVLPESKPDLPEDFREPTQIGETLAGIFAYAGLAGAVIIMLA